VCRSEEKEAESGEKEADGRMKTGAPTLCLMAEHSTYAAAPRSCASCLPCGDGGIVCWTRKEGERAKTRTSSAVMGERFC